MIVNVNKRILIVGLGLIGGSYAMGLRKFGFHVSAITRSQSSIDYAMEHGIIDDGKNYPDSELISSANIIIFSLYPQTFKDWIRDNKKYISKGTLITDVTGVKSCIVYDIQEMLGDGAEFISAHPMAGKEVYGVENSSDRIFKDANYIITPTEKNTEDAIETCAEIGRLLGFARISQLTPEEHDRMIGFVSQLTHCIAISLMTCNDDEHIEKFTGDSFRDLTRIARINDSMWSELFLANKDALLEQMETFEKQFDVLKKAIKEEDVDQIRQIMRLSTQRRALFDK